MGAALLSGPLFITAMKRNQQEIHDATARKIPQRHRRRLLTLAKVVSHLFRKGKLGLKVAIKIPFFADVEFNVETEWERRA